MNWWGPILWSITGTERNGTTVIGPEEWLAHPGSVGRAVHSILRICDENGAELPAGDEGIVYFEQPQRSFEYHNAPDKTASATHPIHDNWTSLGDVGYVDSEGYLDLTDRKAYMIISGGVNIYLKEIEDASSYTLRYRMWRCLAYPMRTLAKKSKPWWNWRTATARAPPP